MAQAVTGIGNFMGDFDQALCQSGLTLGLVQGASNLAKLLESLVRVDGVGSDIHISPLRLNIASTLSFKVAAVNGLTM